jgi:hypothetical protein
LSGPTKPLGRIGCALIRPLVQAALALALSLALAVGLLPGDAALLMVLSASASYIVVPAVLRYAIPEANPLLRFGLSLGVTFPMNLLVGIPLHTTLAQRPGAPLSDLQDAHGVAYCG